MPILTGNFGMLIMCVIVSAVLAGGMAPPLRMMRVVQFFCQEIRRRIAESRRARRARVGLPPTYPWPTSSVDPTPAPPPNVAEPLAEPVPSTSAIAPPEAQQVECPPLVLLTSNVTPQASVTSTMPTPQPSTSGVLRGSKSATRTQKPSTNKRRAPKKGSTVPLLTGILKKSKKSVVTSSKSSTTGLKAPPSSTTDIPSSTSAGTVSAIPSTTGVPAIASGPSTQPTPGSVQHQVDDKEPGKPIPSTSSATGVHGDTAVASRKRQRRKSSENSSNPSPRRPRRGHRSKSRTSSESDSSSTPARSPTPKKQRRH